MRNIEILVILETLEDLRLLDENNKMQTTKRLLDENNKMQKTNYVSTRSADALQAYPRLKNDLLYLQPISGQWQSNQIVFE